MAEDTSDYPVLRRIRLAMDRTERPAQTIGAADVAALCAIGEHSHDQRLRMKAKQTRHHPPEDNQYPVDEVRELLDWIEADLEGRTVDPEPEPLDRGENTPTVDDRAATSQYASWTKTALLREIQSRGLMANNQQRKAELIDVLERDDAGEGSEVGVEDTNLGEDAAAAIEKAAQGEEG